MNSYPEYVKAGDTKYKINTDFRVALECERIAQKEGISDSERTLAILYKLFGEKGLKEPKNYEKLVELAVRYLQCDTKPNKTSSNEEPDMDMIQDWWLIEPSFKSDYGIDLEKEHMHWWKFYRLLGGLTETCVLNRIREIRSMDLSELPDNKTRNKYKELQKQYALKVNISKEPTTEKQRKSAELFYKLTGIKEKE